MSAMNLSDFSLLKEDSDNYTIGHPKGRSMVVPKRGISEKAQKLIAGLKREQHLAEGTPEGTEVAMANPAGPSALDEQASKPLEVEAIPSTAPPPPQAEEELPVPVEAPPLAQDPLPPENPLTRGTADMNSELANAQKIAAQDAKAKAVAGFKEAQALGDYVTQAKEQQDALNSRVNDYKMKDDAFQQKLMSQQVDPNRFMNNLDTGSKMSASLAMILGGIGSGITHQPNMAIEQINRAINSDIQSQMNDESKTMNLWKMNREAMGNDTQATLQTQNQMLGIAKAKAAQAGAMAQGPAAKAAALAPILQWDNQINQNHQLMAIMDMNNQPKGGGGSQLDPSRLVNSLVQDPHQKEQIFKEISAAQDTTRMAKSILTSFDQAAKENTIMKTGAGYLRTPASVYALHQSMQPTFKDLEGTVRQAAMDNTFRNITPAPGDTDAKIATKRKALEDYLTSKMSAPTAMGNNIDLSKYASTNVEAALHGKAPGSIVSVKGQNYRVASDGDTLLPL